MTELEKFTKQLTAIGCAFIIALCGAAVVGVFCGSAGL